MDNHGFRAYFLVRYKLGKTVSEIHFDLVSTFPDSCPGFSTVKTWSREFRAGTFTLEKRTSSGQPRETRTTENIAAVERLVANNPRMTPRQVTVEVSLPPTTILRILTEDLGFKNLLSVLIPYNLPDSNKSQRVECC